MFGPISYSYYRYRKMFALFGVLYMFVAGLNTMVTLDDLSGKD